MTLSLQLKKLEKDGLISRKVYGRKPPIKVIYNLTDLGKSFVPILEAITQWGNQVISEKGEFVNSKLSVDVSFLPER
jgi:DNA-binding HxlR family transcriptional regulator